MNLSQYLRKILPNPSYDRPFVCDGLPQSCTVMIIGENPATRMQSDWWSFWDDKTGFDLRRFEASYSEARILAGKRPVTNTRLRLKRFREAGLNCLETNVYRNERANGHGGGVNSRDMLRALINHLSQLEAVISHGKIANEFASTLTLPPHVRRFEQSHFRSESYANIDRVIGQLLSRQKAPQLLNRVGGWPTRKLYSPLQPQLSGAPFMRSLIAHEWVPDNLPSHPLTPGRIINLGRDRVHQP